jgi:hypothetical protein
VCVVQLTAQQFNDVLESLEQGNRSLGNSDQRRHGRLEVHSKVAVASVVDNKLARRYSAIACDISTGGIGLYQSQATQAGDRLLVWLPCTDKSTTTVVCSVAHCKVLADGIFGVGAEFVQDAAAQAARPPG